MGEPAPIYDQILAFSRKQSPWQQDLLRRLVANPQLTPEELDHALQMCRAQYGLDVDAPQTPQPLAERHLPSIDKTDGAPVTLASLRDFEGVNALLPGQVLSVAPTGLTTVFGYNGSGKSGYARVLKRLCRARGAIDPILPDVFDATAPPPQATVEFLVGDEARSWRGDLSDDDTAGPDALSHIGVYDRASGSSFFTSTQKVELLPSGLDLLPRLRHALDHVNTRLQEEERADRRREAMPAPPPGTKAARFVERLGPETSTAEIDEASSWSAEDQAKLETIEAELARLKAPDRMERATELERRAMRLETLSNNLSSTQHALRPAVAERVAKVVDEHRRAQEAQGLHATTTLEAGTLPGTGGEAWRLLWDAARSFSTSAAYPDGAFPVVGVDARCVLCQQDLDDGAQVRLQGFDAFVKDAVAQALESATTAKSRALEYLSSAVPNRLHDDSSREEAAAAGVAPDEFDAFVAVADARRDALKRWLEKGVKPDDVPAMPAPPVDALDRKAAQDRANAQQLRKGSSPDVLAQKSAERAELQGRKALHEKRHALVAEVERLQRQERRAKARHDCSTGSLTHLVRKLTEQFVTEALVQAFNRELTALGGTRLRVALEGTGARKGEAYTGLVLRDVSRDNASVASVLSEGEQRAVSLAAFFAELYISPTRSAIVFDDPVNSLDHRWREKVANRLAVEARRRQVVVFTHDAVFAAMLGRSCAAVDVAYSGSLVQQMGQRPGHCSDSPPWATKSVRDRVNALKQLHVQLAKVHREDTEVAYANAVVTFLDRLRKTWERAVEECLFNGCIRRFGYGVETQRLKLVDVTDGDYDALERGMAKCSEWVHDAAEALSNPPPTPPELAAMLNDLVAWVQQLRDRRGGQKSQLPSLKALAVSQ